MNEKIWRKERFSDESGNSEKDQQPVQDQSWVMMTHQIDKEHEDWEKVCYKVRCSMLKSMLWSWDWSEQVGGGEWPMLSKV